MIDAQTLLIFLAASLALALAPGPDNIFVLTQSALNGQRAGLAVVLGLFTGVLAHTAAVALGVAAIFATSQLAFTALKLVGAAYLLYLAWQAWRAPPTDINAPAGAAGGSLWPLYRRGVVMNITNPKVAIFFLAFLPQFTDPARGSVSAQVMLLGVLFIVGAAPIFGAAALAGAALGRRLRNSARLQQVLNRLAAVVFVGLALKLAAAQR